MKPIDASPLVSVIIPVYNGETFLAPALESALRQSHSNLEIIVVDDGSTDGTPAILEEYAGRDARVRLFTQKNAGVAAARNRAIAESRSDFIAPLDADDLWEPAKIEKQLRRMLESGEDTGLVYCGWVWIDVNGTVVDRSPNWVVEGGVFAAMLEINFIGNASIPLFRRQFLQEAGGYNSQLAAARAGGCEDWQVALRIAADHRVAVVPEPLVGYRRRPGSMSTACDTMWRSKELVMQVVRPLRPDVPEETFRRSGRQFSLYLAGLAFWSGDVRKALLWGRRAGVRLPLAVLPHVLKMLWRRLFKHKPGGVIMVPGQPLDTSKLPKPLIPYDRIYRKLNVTHVPSTGGRS